MTQQHSTLTVKEQANRWYSKIERGLSSSEKSELVAWCNQNEEHHKALRKLGNIWTDLSILNDLNGLFPLEKKSRYPSNQLFLHVSLFFALVCFLLISMRIFDTDPKQIFNDIKAYANNEINQRYETRIGQQNEIELPDGSTATLNTDTILEINFTQNHRRLILVKGEAKFNVSKDYTRPFTVITGESSFTALGTIFNVEKANDKNIELLVTEGRVLVADAKTEISELIDNISTTNSPTLGNVILHQGEKTKIENNIHYPIQKLTEAELKQDLAWQKGILIFDGEPLSNALDEVSRYTEANFTIVDNELSHLKISGYFKTHDIEGLLQSLYYNFDVHYKQTNANSIQLMVEPN